MVISKLVKIKTNSSIGYLDKAIKPLVLIVPKISRYIQTFKVRQGDQDKI